MKFIAKFAIARNFDGLKFWRIVKHSPKSAFSITEPGAKIQLTKTQNVLILQNFPLYGMNFSRNLLGRHGSASLVSSPDHTLACRERGSGGFSCTFLGFSCTRVT